MKNNTNTKFHFQDLMLYRIHEILLVASPYDAFILEEDGKLTEQILSEYLGMNLSYAPRVWNANSAKNAIEMIENRFFDYYLPEYNLIIERDGQQHYKHVGLFANGDKNYLIKQQANDLCKTQLAKKYGHKIARIPYWLTAEQEEQEIANILAGNPTYPDVPDPNQEETKPLPGMFLPQPTNNFLGFVREY